MKHSRQVSTQDKENMTKKGLAPNHILLAGGGRLALSEIRKKQKHNRMRLQVQIELLTELYEAEFLFF